MDNIAGKKVSNGTYYIQAEITDSLGKTVKRKFKTAILR
jgi:hypothetical protein